MARIARLIIYDGDEQSLAKQLASSMSEGIHEKSKITITIINLSIEPVLNGFVKTTERNTSMQKVFQNNYGGTEAKEKSNTNLDLELRKIDLQTMADR